MDQKFIQTANLREKLKLIEQQDKKLPPQELENFYKLLHSSDKDASQLLEAALEKNFGGLLPDRASYSADYNEGVFKRITQSLEDLELFGLYVKYIGQNCRAESWKPLYKQLGFEAEKLIRRFRQQGTIKEKLLLDKEIVVQMVSKLCPHYMNYNPELFSLMLTSYQKVTNLPLLESLADSLLLQCKDNTNLNDHHDWLVLLSTILDQAYEQKGMGMCLLIEKMGCNKLESLIEENKNYLLINYFNEQEKSVKIIKGLIRFSILPESITLITAVTDMLRLQMKNNQSRNCFNILVAIYENVILPDIVPNMHMHLSIFELLLVYMVGLQEHVVLPNDTIKIICERIKLIIDLKWHQRDQFKQIGEFIHMMQFAYPQLLKQNEHFNKFYKICKERYFDEIQITPSYYDNWSQNELSDDQLDLSLYDRETYDVVGLENLTNTCFMNSILQSLYMTESFRRFVLTCPPTETAQFKTLKKLFMLLTYQKAGYCSPYELKRTLRAPYGNSNDQQDVGEFAHHFLEDFLQQLPEKEKQILEDIFFGCHKSIIQCPNCPPLFGQKEKFLGLDLHFHQNNDLYDMIKQITEEELIEFTCEKCNEKSNEIKKYQQIVQLPSVLFMTIQRYKKQQIRFKFDTVQQSMTKILTKVPMRFEINMRDVFSLSNLDPYDSHYILYAFIVHLGKNSFSGHYICYARSMTNPETWITFDDTEINKQNWSSEVFDTQLIDEETPYLLFYKNKSGHPLVFNN